ncbi:MAG TPA: hypothetical protein VLA46_09785 [Saprospiraceae bacterium]|nr:hypothetical protein [Saprospiraceae bacterium]
MKREEFLNSLPEGLSFTFFSGKKVTKNLVALKTRFGFGSFAWPSGLLSRLFVFHVLFLTIVIPYRVLSLHETGRSYSSDNLARQAGYLFEVIFFKSPFQVAAQRRSRPVKVAGG